MVENFVAEIQTVTPLILGKRLVGDSLLAGIAFERHGDWRRAIAELPIEAREGVPQMSVALPYNSSTRNATSVTFIRSIMRDMDHDPDLADMLIKMPPKSKLTTETGPFSNLSNTYTTRDITKLYFIGRGDINGVLALLTDATFIGSQRAKGYGEVATVAVWKVNNPAAEGNPWFGIVGKRNGRNAALRPIPKRLESILPPNLDGILSNETWHNPYWPGHESAVSEPCFVPPFMPGEGFSNIDENEICLLV